MKIRLDQVDEPFVWQETLEVAASEWQLPELVEISAIACRGEVSPLGDGYLLNAVLSYDQKLCCVRCLEPIVIACSSPLDLVVQVGRRETPGQEQELEPEDLGLLLLEDTILDTRPILVEQVLLNLPMKPLCKPDCAGLCAGCGADLNSGPCACDSASDPRWQALAALRRAE